MTQLDELALLRFDAETGRVTAVEVVERATELAADCERWEEEFFTADEERAAYLRTLNRIVARLGAALDKDDATIAGQVRVILDAISYARDRRTGLALVDVETLQEVLNSKEL